MRNRAPAAMFAVLLLSSVGREAVGQSDTRRPVRAGDVSGLEMSLEGAQQVAPGTRLRWLMTLYEVVGQQDFRPAAGAAIRAAASYRREEPVAELTTDRHGRATLEVEVPGDLEGSFHVVLEAVSRSRVRRRFQVVVALAPTRSLTLHTDRRTVAPGEPIRLIGLVVAEPSGSPVEGAEVTVRVADDRGRPLRPELRLTTGAAGELVAELEAPEDARSVAFEARVVEGGGSARATVTVRGRRPPALVVTAVPRRSVLRPGDTVEVDVAVRRPDGRPVAGAVVEPPGSERSGGVSARAEPIRTDSAGRASFDWTPGALVPATEPVEATAQVRVVRSGLGSGAATVRARLARQRAVLRVAVEGGALLPGVPGRVYVRAVRADGAPVAAGEPVRLVSPLLGEASSEVGERGVAVLEVTARRPGPGAGSDRCGGATAAAAVVTVGRDEAASRIEPCIPVDPDGTLRVRPARRLAIAGEELAVELTRSDGVRGVPVVVTLLRRAGDRLVPLSHSVVGAQSSVLAVHIPDDLQGEALLRARPLIGSGEQEVRGGSALVLVSRSAPSEAEVVPGPEHVLRSRDGTAGRRRGLLVALPAQEGRDLVERLRAAAGPLSATVAEPGGPDSLLLEGELASRTPVDHAAPALLRGRQVVAAPAPTTPVVAGILRDPWRARARFVRGRLALVLRAIESFVAASAPGMVDDVAVRTPRGWRFNRELLEAVTSSDELGGEGARGLGGEPLALEDLERLDAAFTFDNVARRVTRERLLRALVTLRRFVVERGLDLDWAVRGDPSSWLAAIVGHGDYESGVEGIDANELHDGWGRPLAIRQIPAGVRPFSFLAPLPTGWELVSAGPDGRFGTADDVRDPFARVLPSGGAYAEAVGEDVLLARLAGVEVGRATVETLAEVFSAPADRGTADARGVPGGGDWASVPSSLGPGPGLDELERPWLPARGAWSPPVDVPRGGATLRLELGDEPREHLLVGVVVSASGTVGIGQATVRSGVPVLLDASLPTRLRAGEPLELPVTIAVLHGGPSRLVLEASGDEAVGAALPGGGSLELAPGEGGTVTTRLRLEPRGEGSGTVRLLLRGEDGRPVRSLEALVRVDDGGLLRSQVASVALSRPGVVRIAVPRDAGVARGALVLTGRGALPSDRDLRPLLERDPALLAWAHALVDGEVPEPVAVALRRAGRSEGRVAGSIVDLSTACGIVAWATAPEEDRASHEARARAEGAIVFPVPVPGEGDEGEVDLVAAARSLREAAATLAALASIAPSGMDGEDQGQLPRYVRRLRETMRWVLRAHRGDAGLMAQAAGALLLADPRDARGLAMLATARESLAPGLRGGSVVAVEAGGATPDGRDEVAATAALAVAARQVGDDALADELAAGLAARVPVAMALGGEAAFWLLAAGVYGAFGVGEPPAVVVEVDGATPRRVSLARGRAVVPVPVPAAGRELLVRLRADGEATSHPLARTVVTYSRPPTELAEGPLRARIDGEAGYAGETAALEIVIRNEADVPVRTPVLLVALPAAAVASPSTLSAISSAGGVLGAEPPDRRGVLRLELASMAAGAELTVPLPVEWIATGRVRGLAVAAFAADRPWELAVSPEREIDLEPPPAGF